MSARKKTWHGPIDAIWITRPDRTKCLVPTENSRRKNLDLILGWRFAIPRPKVTGYLPKGGLTYTPYLRFILEMVRRDYVARDEEFLANYNPPSFYDMPEVRVSAVFSASYQNINDFVNGLPHEPAVRWFDL